jgi:hypothetical protein
MESYHCQKYLQLPSENAICCTDDDEINNELYEKGVQSYINNVS